MLSMAWLMTLAVCGVAVPAGSAGPSSTCSSTEPSSTCSSTDEELISALQTPKQAPSSMASTLEWQWADMSRLVENSGVWYKIPTDLDRQPDPRMKEYASPGAQSVEYSLIINSHNRPHILRQSVLSSVLSARGPYEIILFCDGCNEETLQVAENTFHETWKLASGFTEGSCSHDALRQATDPQNSLPDEFYIRQQSVLRSSCAGALDNQCGRLLRSVLIDQTPAIFETAANNRGALVAAGRFLIFMQDDMMMTQLAWNVQLSLPSRIYGDVFGVSARCAHGSSTYPAEGIGRCNADIYDGQYNWSPTLLEEVTARTESPVPKELSEQVDVFFSRPTANRGPLLYSRQKFVQMGFFDEVHHLMGDDEHDINIRAFEENGWVNGFVPIQFHTLSQDRNSSAMQDNGFQDGHQEESYRQWRQHDVPAMPRVSKRTRGQNMIAKEGFRQEERPLSEWRDTHTLCA